MNYLSLFSGIEAASVAWAPLGWKPVGFAEVDPFASAVLAHHYPDVPNFGDVNNFKEWPDLAIDLVCGGSPCQSFSNAGLRAGLDDPRGQLMLTFGAVVARYRPKWVVWENVPGVLSSGGGCDFASLLGLLSGQSITPPQDGWQSAGIVAGIPDAYGLAWRVLDAQFVRVDGYARAVPQRRQRVFVVGCLGDWRSAAAVLLERESLRGDPAQRRSAGAGIAPCLRAGATNGSPGHGQRSGDSRDELIVPVAGSLCANGKAAGSATQQDAEAGMLIAAYGGNNTRGPIEVGTTLLSQPGSGYKCDFESETFVAHTLRGEGFDASEDGTGRGTPLVAVGVDGYNGSLTGGVACTMGTPGSSETASGHPTVMVPVGVRSTAPTLTTTYGKQPDSSDTNAGPMLVPMGHALPFDTTQITSASNYSNPKAGDPCHPLAAGALAPAVAFNWQGGGTQTTLGYDPQAGVTGALHVGQTPAVAGAMAVRRLLPVECERLQGFADDYTRIPNWNGWRKLDADETPERCTELGLEVRQNKKTGAWRVKDVDGPRYKALGNSWACNVARWVGRRIELVELAV